MYCNKYSATDYQKNHRTFSCNIYWVIIKQGEREIYRREPDKDTWLDDSHKRITKALEELEAAILAAPVEG